MEKFLLKQRLTEEHILENKTKELRKEMTIQFHLKIQTQSHLPSLTILSIDDHSFAEIQHLNVEHTGPIRSLTSDSITPSSQKVLYEDYFTYSKERIEYILTEQIVDKLCNLSNCNLILLTIMLR